MKRDWRVPGAACLCSSSTEEGARKEAFSKAIGIPVRHLETLTGGDVLNDGPWSLSPEKLTVYRGKQQMLSCS